VRLAYVYERHPDGIRSLILSSTNPSASMWVKEQHRLVKYLPEKEQKAIAKACGKHGLEVLLYGKQVLFRCLFAWSEESLFKTVYRDLLFLGFIIAEQGFIALCFPFGTRSCKQGT